MNESKIYATGRRKTSSARVYMLMKENYCKYKVLKIIWKSSKNTVRQVLFCELTEK